MSELLDDSKLMKERRGQTILVLSILSWIWIGFSFLVWIFTISQGKKTTEEMEFEKFKLYETATPELIEIMGESYIADTLSVMEVSNHYFYSIQISSFITILIGFYGVIQMYNLKKKGFYFYLLYNILPIITGLVLFELGFLMIIGIIFNVVFSALFCILYVVQLKRMA